MESKIQKPFRKSFRVPESMPDGVHKRKLEKIKKTLDHNSEVKRSYRKTLRKMGLEVAKPSSDTAVVATEVIKDENEIKTDAEQTEDDQQKPLEHLSIHAERKQKLSRFKREEAAAAQVRAEREARERDFQRRAVEKKEKIAAREKAKKKMNQYTQRGQPKLGPKVGVLLDRIRKQTAA
ncbi:uncharacterized protein V2V93DRAFT_362874 [Kockiozyma suomiensis]|uniref:uncharacterized protein n=1 Tax=Kockiozyma suomiensis TaxID=1337062 RepID=UPI003343014A